MVTLFKRPKKFVVLRRRYLNEPDRDVVDLAADVRPVVVRVQEAVVAVVLAVGKHLERP